MNSSFFFEVKMDEKIITSPLLYVYSLEQSINEIFYSSSIIKSHMVKLICLLIFFSSFYIRFASRIKNIKKIEEGKISHRLNVSKA